jgi:hypothetical protein
VSASIRAMVRESLADDDDDDADETHDIRVATIPFFLCLVTIQQISIPPVKFLDKFNH